MTPERAMELATERYKEFRQNDSGFTATLYKAIIQACAEEREACAKIAEDSRMWIGDWEKKYGKGCEIWEAIRGGA